MGVDVKTIQYRLAVILSIIILFGLVSAQTVLTKVGQHPFLQPSLTSSTELITMLQDNENDLKKGFDLAGQSDLFDYFMMHLPNAQIVQINLPQWSHFEWMLGKKYGTGPVCIVKDVTWVNKAPLAVYQFYIDKSGNRYNFIVPLICGNIALRGITRSPAVIAIPTVDTTPVVTAQPTVDTIDKPTEPIVEPTKQIVERKKDVSPAQGLAVTGARTFNFLTDLGYFHQFDPYDYLIVRAGAEYNFSNNYSGLALIGAAPLLRGTDGKTAFLIDLLVEINFSRSFVDLGIGTWITSGNDILKTENTQIDFITVIGTRIFGEPDAFNASLFLEARNGLEELNSIHNIRSFGRYGGGLRFRF